MKNYDHEEDHSESQEQQHEGNQKLQHFQDDYNMAKLTADVNELYIHHKSHDTNIRHLLKDVGTRVTEFQLSQAIALINSGIQTDPNVIKLLKTKEQTFDEEQNKIRLNAMLFSRKVNQMSESTSVLLTIIRKLQAKITTVEADLAAQFNQKHNSLQIQIQENRGDQIKQGMQLQQKMQLISFELSDKMRDVDTKVNWKLNQFKQKVDDKISEQLVKQYLQQSEIKIDKSMKEYQLKSDIRPQRIQKIENDIEASRLKAENGITQCDHKISCIRREIDQELLKEKIFEENRLKIQKRLQLFNVNFNDVYERVKGCQSRQIKMDGHIVQLLKDSQFSVKQLGRINLVLTNLKIGDDFQKMLQEMNPVKVLQLQGRVDDVHNQQASIFRQIELANRQIHKINAKSDIMGVMQPNKARQKMKKEQVEDAIGAFLQDHQFMQKISSMDKQLNNYKLSMDAVTVLTKQVSRLQKQSNTQQLYSEIRILEENMKRELLIVQNQVREKNFLKDSFNVERPFSKGGNGEVTPIGQASNGRSFSVKRLNKVTSFYNSSLNSGINPTNQLLDRKSLKN